ncbi:MAG: Outer rane lipoproteinsorting protein-like protein, partial [Ilumatobacteraceae bacterium]|nr:Outer rane lipoproteinsorting protein-like protein [Ilumatobacteraceae bacterium]
DAATGLPLDVRIDAKSGSSALEFGFTKIDFDTPASSTFDFTPPPGSTVVEVSSPLDLIIDAGQKPDEHHDRGKATPDAPDSPEASATDTTDTGLGGVSTVGSDWSTAAIVPSSTYSAQLDAFLGGAERIAVGAGSARVLTTRLVTVLVFDDGHLAIGALTPSALAAVVAAG